MTIPAGGTTTTTTTTNPGWIELHEYPLHRGDSNKGSAKYPGSAYLAEYNSYGPDGIPLGATTYWSKYMNNDPSWASYEGWYGMQTVWTRGAATSSTISTPYAGVATSFTVNGSDTVTYPGAGSGNGSTPVSETRVLTLSGVTAAAIQYAVPSGGYLKIEW